MIHFLWSIFFLVLTMALVLAYVIVSVVLFGLLCTAIQFIREYRQYALSVAWDQTMEWLQGWILKLLQSKIPLYVLLLILSVNISIYLKQRVEWMGDDNGNLTAKEYWVAGQVVYGYRNIYCLAKNHPEDWFIRPFNWLQQWIFHKGSQYLPENDGELGVWEDIWFIYPYSRGFHNTKGVNGYKPSPRMIALVERCWASLKKQATGEWADCQMKEQHYFRNFPGQAFYYASKEAFLTGKFVGGGILLAQNKDFLNRDRRLLEWLGELKEKWQTSPRTMEFIHQHPKVEAFRQLIRQMEAGRLVRGSIHSKEFSCESPEVKQYLAQRKEFVGDEKTPSAVQRMAEKAQARRMYNIGVNMVSSRFLSYALDRFCGIQTAGEEDMKKYTGSSIPIQDFREMEMKNLFGEEIKILEEMYNGR